MTDIKLIMNFHALMCILIGIPIICLPHRFYEIQNWKGNRVYNHVAHEYLRMYGAVTLVIGWIVWRLRNIDDGRVHRIFCEGFAICYLLQAGIMTRAEYYCTEGHSSFHIGIIITFLVIGILYGVVRLTGNIKTFELPGGSRYS
jgi:hypothetical protein